MLVVCLYREYIKRNRRKASKEELQMEEPGEPETNSSIQPELDEENQSTEEEH